MKDAVFMFRAPYRKRDGSGINWPFTCTGTLINQNTNQNSIREIFVTAEHCCNDYERWDHDDNPSTPDVDGDLVNDNIENWIFNFNYSSPGLNNN